LRRCTVYDTIATEIACVPTNIALPTKVYNVRSKNVPIAALLRIVPCEVIGTALTIDDGATRQGTFFCSL